MFESDYNKSIDIAKSDTVNFDGSVSTTGGNVRPADGIYVGGAGVVAVVTQNGAVSNFTAVPGQTIPVRAIRVNSTNTTATLMLALYKV